MSEYLNQHESIINAAVMGSVKKEYQHIMGGFNNSSYHVLKDVSFFTFALLPSY